MPTSRPKKVANAASSRYTQGGTTDVYPNRTGWWERRKIEKDDTDMIFEVQPDEAKRPDLIAAHAYDRDNLGWVVLQYNNIVDIETELLTGKVLRLPSLRRLTLDVLSRQTGGNTIIE